MPRLLGACGQAQCLALFVLDDEALELAFLRRGSVERLDVQLTEALDVEWTAVLVEESAVSCATTKRRRTLSHLW